MSELGYLSIDCRELCCEALNWGKRKEERRENKKAGMLNGAAAVGLLFFYWLVILLRKNTLLHSCSNKHAGFQNSCMY